MKRCTKCGEEKPLTTEYFYRKGDGLENACKVCRLQSMKYRQENPLPVKVPPPEGYKRCSTCDEVKSLDLFFKTRSNRTGFQSQCKACTAPYQRDYRSRKKGEIRKQRSRRYSILASRERIDLPEFKQCSTCKEIRPSQDFGRNRTKLDGLQSQCKSCESVAGSLFYEANKDRILSQMKEDYHANPERKKTYSRLYGQQHRRETSARAKKWRDSNPDRARELGLKHGRSNRARHPDRYRAHGQNRRARKMSLPNTWTPEQWARCLEYWRYRCAACESQLRDLFGNIEPNADHWTPITDPRPDNPGTVKENMICLCNLCNSSKSNKDPVKWLEWKFGKKKAAVILARIIAYFEWVKTQPE